MSAKVSNFNTDKSTTKELLIIGGLITLCSSLGLIYTNHLHYISMAPAGLMMIFFGILRLVYALSASQGGSTALRYTYAVLLIVAGLWVFANPNMDVKALGLFFILFFSVDGLVQILYAMSSSVKNGNRSLLVSGGFSLILAAFLALNFGHYTTIVLGFYLGVKCLGDGLGLIFSGRRTPQANTSKLLVATKSPVNIGRF